MNTNDLENLTNAAAGIVAGQALAAQAATMTAIIHYAEEDDSEIPTGRPYLVSPTGVVTNMEGYLGAPVMRRGDVVVHDALSFAAYVNRFKDADTVIFADQMTNCFTGVIDYHHAGPEGGARWGRHRVTLKLQLTESWGEWCGANKTSMNQTEFANFIEERIPDIAEPNGADIVTMSRALEAKKDVSFQSHIRADNGAHLFHYDEVVQGSVKGGTIAIPNQFTLALVPFLGAATYAVKAWFRYRLEGKTLKLWYELVRPRDVIEKAFADEREDITTVTKDVPMFLAPAPGVQKAE